MTTTQQQPTMRRVRVFADRGVTVETVPIPEPTADEVLVRSISIGVCGSDTHALHGRHP